jgi:ankyrin repeat protein
LLIVDQARYSPKGEIMVANVQHSILMFIIVLTACTQSANDVLIRAAKKGDVKTVERSIANGADVNFITPEGKYALEEAVSANRAAVVKMLLAKGAKPHHMPGKMTPAEIAASNGYLETLRVFLDSGFDVNIKQTYGYTLLHIAAQDGESEVIELLAKRGAGINARDDSGATPLYHAAGTNHANCVKVLLDAGANPNIQTTDGNCPLTVALAEGYSEIVTMLKNKGARECR